MESQVTVTWLKEELKRLGLPPRPKWRP